MATGGVFGFAPLLHLAPDATSMALKESGQRSTAARLTVAGALVGLVMAFIVNRILATLLFGVRASDPATTGAVVALIGGVALVACYLPARAATRVDPMVVLRED